MLSAGAAIAVDIDMIRNVFLIIDSTGCKLQEFLVEVMKSHRLLEKV